MKFTFTLCLVMLCSIANMTSILAQPNFTANDQVLPYEGRYGVGTNVGWYPNWRLTELGDIAMGNPKYGVEGIGINTTRQALFEFFQEQWGYEFRIPAIEHFDNLGSKDQVIFVGYPSEAHRDTTHYCPDKRSELFKNLYEPIWDDGLDGTPYNEDNYYAAYLYKTVDNYKAYVKFWEIWNEPDFSFTANSIYDVGVAGNWWENDPAPCDFDIHAPVQHYIRMLRISWEIIKTIDPTAYVAIGGIGYPSFLDAVLRQTDNPDGGEVTPEFPLKGGAYFDVLSYHTYPHIDGSLRTWNNALGGFTYKRNTDNAVEGVLQLRNEFDAVLRKHDYNGAIFPEKEWIITECNVPRKPLNEGFGSDEVQRNFIIKALVETWRVGIKQFHIYNLGDRLDYVDAKNKYQEYEIMGLFKNMNTSEPYKHEMNDLAIAYKTTSELLEGYEFDHASYDALELPFGVKGSIFKHKRTGKKMFVLWAKTTDDNSENALMVLDLKSLLGLNKMILKKWDFSVTGDSTIVNANNIVLRGDPYFVTLPESRDDGWNNVVVPNTISVYPNPFEGDLNIAFELDRLQKVELILMNEYGRIIKRIIDYKEFLPGYYNRLLDGKTLKPGVYFLHYITPEATQIRKIVLMGAY